jgi:hypothetical protein
MTKNRSTLLTNIHSHHQLLGGIMPTFFRSLVLLLAIVCLPVIAFSQGQTMGTLNLRNTQPQTISLSIPSAGVTGYTLHLPPTAGQIGQALTVGAVTGSTAELSWTDASFWHLDGSAITTGGVGAGQQYLGTSNAQDLVLAANASEGLRIVGAAGPTQGYIGLGTATPQAPIDLGKNVLLSNTGAATELRFAEPTAGGSEYTAFKAGPQTANITYTLPLDGPAQDGLVLTTTQTGDLSWRTPFYAAPKGVYNAVQGEWIHVINVGPVLTANSVPLISIIHNQGAVIGASIVALDPGAGTITVETSIGLLNGDRIAWTILN